MSLSESRHGVWLDTDRVGTLHQRGDYTWFTLAEDYVRDPGRPVLGLVFEENLAGRHASALRLPPWFSNLLPEGPLRRWIANDRGVSVDREMELLAQVGHDLPGAVRVLPDYESPEVITWDTAAERTGTNLASGEEPPSGWRFSLAGVALKFSMVRKGDRLVLPAYGEGGDWIVKLPDRVYPDVPRNEYTMMSLAAAVGIDVPELRLVHRDKLDGLPPNIWPESEEWAYAVRRFDRGANRELIHIEDLAQVRNVYPDKKYSGNFETVAALVYRRRDVAGLRELARRLAFVVLISNGDAHLKNWSLIYRDRRSPTLSPVYDLVSTAVYQVGDTPDDLGLRFAGSRRFDRTSLASFARLQQRLDARQADLPAVVAETVERVRAEWPKHVDLLGPNHALRSSIGTSIESRSITLLRNPP
ncbi:MAG TPA: HipA domain-containing protein [Mycobacteriales bacterium]|nr:HipA domain-containing protein [Mycobacteriales bacterium]